MKNKSFFGMSFNDCFSASDIFTDALCMSSATNNPSVIPHIDLVYVLSGRTTALGNDADRLKREFDPQDDFARMKKGIELAIAINALRANKKPEELTEEDYVIPIFYNGRPIHNNDLKAALARGTFPYYPEKLFTIHKISPENTLGQVRSFSSYLSYHGMQNKHRHENVAIVSSAYHLPRVARLIGCNSPQVNNDETTSSSLSKLNLFLFGIHKNEKRPGICLDLQGERNAMQNYSSGNNPSISRHSSRNVFFTDAEIEIYKSFNAVKFWGSGPKTLNNNAAKQRLKC